MINELNLGFEAHSSSLASLVDALPVNDATNAAKKLMQFVGSLRSIGNSEGAFADQVQVNQEQAGQLADTTLVDVAAERERYWGQLREALSGRGCEDAMVQEISDVVTKFELPHQYVFDFVKGIEREANVDWFLDFADLETCAYLNSASILLCLFRILEGRVPEESVELSLIELGQADYLVHKLVNFLPQLGRKSVFLPFIEVQDRGIDLKNQSEPIDEDLWKDLIQFQCRRIQEKLKHASGIRELPNSRFKKQLNFIISRNLMMNKLVRRSPSRMLREKIQFGWIDLLKVRFQARQTPRVTLV